MNGNIKRSEWVAAILLGCLMSVPAQAASFDCAKASTKVEHIICDTPEISKLDEDLDVSYKAAVQDKQQGRSIKQTQKQWMRERNNCAVAECVKRIYEKRLSSLKNSAESTVSKERFVVADGKGYAVCRVYLDSLNLPSSSLNCGERIPPGFKRPDWQEMNVNKHLDWVYQILQEQGNVPAGQTFKLWSTTFIEQIKAGKISPQIRKIQVLQSDDEEAITLIAYKDNREGCNRLQKKPLHFGQGGFGFAYFRLLSDEPTVRLLAFSDENGYVSSRTVSELLLYAGKPYLVQTWATDYMNPIGVDILAFYLDRSLKTKAERKIYRVTLVQNRI